MNGSGLEYTTLLLHRQREQELIKEAQDSRLVYIAQQAARRIQQALRGEQQE